MAYFMWILVKNSDEDGSRYKPFLLNRIQSHLIDNLALENLLVKARQMGGTTFMLLYRLLLRAVLEQGFRGLFVSQKQFYANQHFLILDRARRLFGMRQPGMGPEVNHIAISLNQNLLKRRISNRRELIFEFLDSSVVVDTSENPEAGQGFSINGFVGSEFSRWAGNPKETMGNIRGSLAPGATRDLECTANGAGENEFYRLVNIALNGEGIYKLHFYPWYWTDEYRLALEDPQKLELRADLSRINAEMQKELESGEKSVEIQDKEREEWYIKDQAHLDLEQVAWRRKQIVEDSRQFRENYPEDVRSAFLTQGNNYFDTEIVERRRLELIKFKPYKVGRNQEAILFHKPIPNQEYLVSVDPAQGMYVDEFGHDHDWAVMLVWHLHSGLMVGQYKARVRPDQLAADAVQLAKMYNNATIACERNNHGWAVLLSLENEQHYANVYHHPNYESLGNSEAQELPGFPTTPQTRPIALSYLRKHVEENPELIFSEEFCVQCGSFVLGKNGKPQAAPGMHDDFVAAGWVGIGARAYILGFWPIGKNLTPGDDDY